jgi:hypothetical protein
MPIRIRCELYVHVLLVRSRKKERCCYAIVGFGSFIGWARHSFHTHGLWPLLEADGKGYIVLLHSDSVYCQIYTNE